MQLHAYVHHVSELAEEAGMATRHDVYSTSSQQITDNEEAFALVEMLRKPTKCVTRLALEHIWGA